MIRTCICDIYISSSCHEDDKIISERPSAISSEIIEKLRKQKI